MLRFIKKDGQILNLEKKAVITMERNNALFSNADKFIQDLSYSITVPRSDNSEQWFQNGQLVESTIDKYFINDVIFDSSGMRRVKGNIKVSVKENGFEATFEPNLAAINSLVKNVRMPEIRTEDGEFGFTDDSLEARMLDTCRYPERFPYIFFPIKNTTKATAIEEIAHYDFVNYYDTATQQFITRPPAGFPAAFTPRQTAFWKLTHILKQIANYLGLTATGSFFTDPDSQTEVIYSRYAMAYRAIHPSMAYMPNMLLSDFLKFIISRDHLIIDPDLLAGELRIDSFKTITQSTEAVDLTKFVVSDGDMEPLDGQSLTVTLKPDEQDLEMATINSAGDKIYLPLSTLIAGSGEDELEIPCGTLKTEVLTNGIEYPVTKQTVITGIGAGTKPNDINFTKPLDTTTLNNWPLRILKYRGYLPIAGGGYFPCATNHDLNDDDIAWFRFKNDGKSIKPTFQIPGDVLESLKISSKFTHRTKGKNYVTYLAEQILYDDSADYDLKPVMIKARVYSYNEKTKVTIVPQAPPLNLEGPKYNFGSIKAYFDPEKHGINELQLEFYSIPGGIYSDAIKIPTTVKGSGGVAVNILAGPVSGLYGVPVELRIYQGAPKYLLNCGQRIYFTKVANYYKVLIPLWTAPYWDTFIIFF